MTFWILIIGIAVVVSGSLILGLLRRSDGLSGSADYDLRVYRDQLREVERDLERGVLSEADAGRVRTEVSRRILAADAGRQAHETTNNGAPRALAVVLAVILIGTSLSMYTGFGPFKGLGVPGYGDFALSDRLALAEERRETRPSQAEAEASLPDQPTTAEINQDYLTVVKQLRDIVEKRPNDIQGLVLLAQSEANLTNFEAAYSAQAKVIELKGEQATTQDLTDYVDLMVLAAGGYVSPEAEQAARVVLNTDPDNGIARYYVGLMFSQTGRPDLAFRIWDRLLRIGPAEAPWVAPILVQIEELAMLSGVRYQIPVVGSSLAQPSTKGPSSDDIEAAGEMTAAERIEMIEGMVSGLAERLASEGGSAGEWAQLIGALGVLTRTDQAFVVYRNALQVFADDPTAIDLVTRAAQRAGVAE